MLLLGATVHDLSIPATADGKIYNHFLDKQRSAGTIEFVCANKGVPASEGVFGGGLRAAYRVCEPPLYFGRHMAGCVAAKIYVSS